MAIDCPDNSTECLLRALIATTETQVSPWEPRSFGFTVAIGVAAFLISFVAIFQGLLAAGPGRIKASSNAIGNFGKLTKGRLSFVEFAWRSTAYVPIITYDSLRHGLEKQIWFKPHGINYPFRAGSFNTGATWHHLLRCTGLDEEVEVIYRDNLQPCATDHLPADIQAPPLSIQLHCLATLVAIADPSVKLERSDRFINVAGRISQLSFREHPVLGTLGAYECYQTKYTSQHEWYFESDKDYLKKTKDKHSAPNASLGWCTTFALDLAKGKLIELIKGSVKNPKDKPPAPNASLGRCTTFALDLAKGKLTLTWEFGETRGKDSTAEFMNASTSRHWCSLARWHMPHNQMPMVTSHIHQPFARAIILMVARTDYEVRPFPWVMSGLSGGVDCLIEASRTFLQDVDTFKTYIEPSGCQLSALGYTNRNIAHDMMFEMRGSWIVPDNPISEYDIGGDFGPDFSTDLFKTCTKTIDGFINGLGVGDISDTTHFIMNYDVRIESLWWYLKHIDIILRRKRFQSMDVLDALQRRLVDACAAEEAAGKTAPAAPASHPAQSVGSNPSVESRTPVNSPPLVSATPRSSTSSAPSVGVRESLRLSAHSEASTGHRTSHDTRATDKSNVSEDECLECLLIIRGLLYAALLKAGPDTSILWEPDFKNAIVKVM